jgi:hypothetical protein
MDYRDNPRNIMCHHSKWSSFTPPWWSGFTLPLTGVIDRLRQMGWDVIEVNFGGRADSPAFANKRTEMWATMRDWIKEGGILPNIADLKTDLSAPAYSFDASNRMVLERKEAMRKRGIRSPDIADALALTFAQPVYVDRDDDMPHAGLISDHEDPWHEHA